MSLLNKNQILKAEDLTTETVKVPEWGGEVNVRTMTGTERDKFETSLIDSKGKDISRNTANLRAKLLALCIVDKDGKRIFNDKEVDDLGGKSAKALDRLFGVAQKLNGIGEEDVEDLTKN